MVKHNFFWADPYLLRRKSVKKLEKLLREKLVYLQSNEAQLGFDIKMGKDTTELEDMLEKQRRNILTLQNVIAEKYDQDQKANPKTYLRRQSY